MKTNQNYRNVDTLHEPESSQPVFTWKNWQKFDTFTSGQPGSTRVLKRVTRQDGLTRL